mmetsp:Transcript_51691/g.59376  ORF Transcript_51691/g.59376 Transcript_51691/m.59376 type:complete len:145 (+) Transcript_51691:23-457(+)
MSNNLYPLFIKGVTYCAGTYILYEIYQAYKNEKNLGKLEAMRKFQTQSGGENLKDVKDIEREIAEQKKTHYGRKIIERMGTQSMMEEQIKGQMEQKMQLRNRLLEVAGSEDALKKLEEDIKKLDDVFKEIKSDKEFRTDDYKQK